jgi:dTMP kinase
MKGLLITLDGPGGTGKTTTTAHLTRLLGARGHAVHPTSQPSCAPLGEIARRHSDTYHGHALACLVAADRYHHLATEIRPAIAAGRIVLCDRYVASSYVLQRMDGVDIGFIETLNNCTDRPDLAVILTTDPTTAAARIDTRGTRHRFETGVTTSMREHELYQDTAERLAALGYPLLTIDTTTRQADHVAEDIATRITDLLDPSTALTATK